MFYAKLGFTLVRKSDFTLTVAKGDLVLQFTMGDSVSSATENSVIIDTLYVPSPQSLYPVVLESLCVRCEYILTSGLKII